MKKYVCTVCGYIAEGTIPEQCPVCKAPASAFVEKTGNTYVTEHVVGTIQIERRVHVDHEDGEKHQAGRESDG